MRGQLAFLGLKHLPLALVKAQGGGSLGLGLLPGPPNYSRDDFDRVLHFVE